jgi:RNA 2',3'-cyclic 3'-phosphodiesterase
VRLFHAVFPPPEVQRAAAAVTDALRRPGDGISWVKQDNLHFTLRFLGELGESGAGRAARAAERAAGNHRAFIATLGQAGAFPRAAKARVLWLGIETGAAELESLARDLEVALREQGFERADHKFSAHLTLGRVRARDQDWTERLAGVRAEPVSFTVDRVRLVQSTLSPKGSHYDTRVEARLST